MYVVTDVQLVQYIHVQCMYMNEITVIEAYTSTMVETHQLKKWVPQFPLAFIYILHAVEGPVTQHFRA